jgi:hypothetical protein
MRVAFSRFVPVAAIAGAFLSACASTSHTSPEGGPNDAGIGDLTEAGASSGDDGDDVMEVTGDAGSLVFGTGDAATADAGACQHLNIAILGNPGTNSSANFQSWLESAGTSVQRIQTAAPTPAITAATLEPFDVVVLDWLTRDYSADEASVLAAFVSNGGGLITMTGYDNNTTDDWHANSLLVPLEVAYAGPLLDPYAGGSVTSFAAHPITAGITSVTFAGGYAISDLGGTVSTRTPVAFLPNADDGGLEPVGEAIQMAGGRAFVWGDEWISFDSEWTTMPEIKQLWVQIFAWVAPHTACELQPTR